MNFRGWIEVADRLDAIATQPPIGADGLDLLDAGQRASLTELARRIRAGRRKALLADEVGMGKTRIAVALIEAVRQAGGRSAVVLPPGLGAQWRDELRRFNPDDGTLLPLRSYESFIAGFSHPDDANAHERGYMKARAQKRQEDRRLQRELPERSWADERILMISHSFAVMQFQSPNDLSRRNWRRELLPSVVRILSNECSDDTPVDSVEHVLATQRAAGAIADTLGGMDTTHLQACAHRQIGSAEFRETILPLIGRALGRFDLVVVDEAHKTRGEDSSLSRILGPVTWESDDPFRLGMTATPVELNADQWLDTIARISGRDDGQDTNGLQDIRAPLDTYVEVVARLRREELDAELVSDFEAAAAGFHATLAPFVLRRDKRDDPVYASFMETFGDYRDVRPLLVEPDTNGAAFSRRWLRRFAAVEALSHLPDSGRALKRLRLAIPQGLGLGEEVDEDHTETPMSAGPASSETHGLPVWHAALTSGVEPDDIYSHPSILSAVELIEGYTTPQNGSNPPKSPEKVLVFGRFVAPLDALTRLLDAREMLRQLAREDGHWPARGIPSANAAAVRAALKDKMLWTGTTSLDELNQLLSERYRQWENQRQQTLTRLYEEVLSLAETGDASAVLLSSIWTRGTSDDATGAPRRRIAALLEALDSRRGPEARHDWTTEVLLAHFGDLLHELSGEDDTADPEAHRAEMTQRVLDHLEAFSGREGSFARMMSGDTQAQTRRNLQSAFNRYASWPMVLVAQSLVGREGLNLHEACRTVVLLHSEWNPAIVEQQIGRVDRKNSLWIKMLEAWDGTGAPPRINIHPVVVRGTYDEHNWQVLDARWKALRAQLHGDVLPETHRLRDCPLVGRVRQVTPRFAPDERL
jgi:hypothetical protein